MAIIIKRFGVKHKGIRYGPGLPGGSILYGLPEEEEERLISASQGMIAKYTEEEKDDTEGEEEKVMSVKPKRGRAKKAVA